MNSQLTEVANEEFFQDGRHRRLAKAGSPATARGCGELWRALLAAAVAVVVDFHWMGVFCRKVEARRMELEARY